ncbi:hypothetical protein OROGR_028501 [Orobanche gracilis]
MERRDQEEMGNNPMRYTSPQITIQESPVRLPLAPILSTPLTHHRRGPNAFVSSTRRGSSIFSPTQTLVQPSNPPPHNHHRKDDGASPDPESDPIAAPSTGSASTSESPAPQPPQTRGPPPQPVVDNAGATHSTRYRECLKNHAASMGAHVLDGCGEFMTGGEDALKCAACDCHRNFHRKESDGEPQQQNHYYTYDPNSSSSHLGCAPPHHNQTPPPPSAPPHPKHHFSTVPMPPTIVNFGRAAAESSSEDLNMVRQGDGSGGHAAVRPPFSSKSKRRYRTKFRPDQKDRMHEFAMKMGWRIQKQDEQEVEQFCSEVGIRRQVFKVWMHNNKQAMKNRERSY